MQHKRFALGCALALAVLCCAKTVAAQGCTELTSSSPRITLSWELGNKTGDGRELIRFVVAVSEATSPLSALAVCVSRSSGLLSFSSADVFLLQPDQDGTGGTVQDASFGWMKVTIDKKQDIELISWLRTGDGFIAEFTRPVVAAPGDDEDVSIITDGNTKQRLLWAYWKLPGSYKGRRPTDAGTAPEPIDWSASKNSCIPTPTKAERAALSGSTSACESGVTGSWSNGGSFSVMWIKSGNYIRFTVVGRTTGWVGFGFNTAYRMAGSDYYTGWVSSGNVTLIDTYASGESRPSTDTSLGGSSDLINVTGSENTTHTTLSFTRLLNTGDQYDMAITDTSIMTMWALASSDGTSETRYGMHSSFGGTSLNFFDCGATTGGEAKNDISAGGIKNAGQGVVVTSAVAFALFGAIVWLSRLAHHRKSSEAKETEMSPRGESESQSQSTSAFGWRSNPLIVKFSGIYSARAFNLIPFWAIFLAFLYVALNVAWAAWWLDHEDLDSMDTNGKTVAVARVLGQLGAANMLITVIPATRNSILWLIGGQPFERTLPFHRWAGRFTLILLVLHAALFSAAKKKQVMVDADGKLIDTQLYAWIALLCLIVLTLTAMAQLRRKYFNVFVVVHFLFIPFFVLAAMHNDEVVPFVIAAAVIWGADRAFRLFRTAFIHKAEVSQLNDHVVRVQWDKSCKALHEPAQYAFLSFPTVGKTGFLESHPFSITTASASKKCEVNIRGLGNYTRQLVHELPKQSTTVVRVDGPYGQLALDLSHYAHLVLVCVGIGSTPIMSILRDIYSGSRRSKYSELKTVRLVWGVRDRKQFSWFSEDISSFSGTATSSDFPAFNPVIHVSDEVGELEAPMVKGMMDPATVVTEAVKGVQGPVAMIACGVQPLVEKLWDNCTEQRRSGVHIDFHYESFEF